jgi:hypothetical protein
LTNGTNNNNNNKRKKSDSSIELSPYTGTAAAAAAPGKRSCVAVAVKSPVKQETPFSFSELAIYKVYAPLFRYSSCLLTKVIKTRTCEQIHEYIRTNDLQNYNNARNSFALEMAGLVDGGNGLNGDTKKSSANAKKPNPIKAHFLARKLHEEAAAESARNNGIKKIANGHKNGIDNQNGESLDQLMDCEDNEEEELLNTSNSLGVLKQFIPCDHPGQACNELCSCVKKGILCRFL